MKLSSIALLLLFITPALSQAQVVGTCEQYNASSLAGAACLSNGSVASWFKLHGDVSLLTNSNQCSSTTSTGCGLATVNGINNIPLQGTLTPGQAWCLNSAGTMMIPCGSGSAIVSNLTSGTTVTVTSDGSNSIQLEYLILGNNVATINTPAASTMPDGKIIYLAIQQPAGNFDYTIPTCFTAGTGTQVYITNNVAGGTTGFCGGLGVVPGMPTTPYAELDFAFHYRATQPAGGTPILRVMSASQ